MTSGRKKPAPPTASLALTIPSDNRFLDTVQAITERMAEYIGYGAADAKKIAQAVDRTVAGVMKYAYHGRQDKSIDVNYRVERDIMEIGIRYRADSGGASGSELERGLAESRSDGTDLDSLRRVMDRVEFGRDAGIDFCRLTRQLPQELKD